MASTRQKLMDSQRKWARSRGLGHSDKGYLPDVDSNLFAPLSPETKAAFMDGSGSELSDAKTRPAKMKALHSSSALAVNFFDYWVDRDKTPLSRALGLEQEIESVLF